MALYEFKCPRCAQLIEVIQKHSDAAPTCESCAVAMERAISVPARAQFTGTGFYETGYKRKS